jgi:hypothetical protein
MAALALLGGALLGGTADAKQKSKKGRGAANLSKNVELGIPDAVTDGILITHGRLQSTITVGKKFRGKSVGDLKVTYQTTGANPNSAEGLNFRLTAPNSRMIDVRPGGFGGQSIGPLTVTANSPVTVCQFPPPCADPASTLNRPYAGTAGNPKLALFEGVPMRGNWKLSVLDLVPGETSILNSWKLSITPAKPVESGGSGK